MHRMRQLQPVHRAGHLDIGEQQRDIGAGFQDAHGLVSVDGLDGVETGVLDDIDRAHAQNHLVLDDQDVGCRGLI